MSTPADWIEAFAARTAAMLPNGCTASGLPLRRSVLVIAGCRVTCRAWDDRVRFEVITPDYRTVVPASCEGLTLAEAVAAVTEATR